MVEYSENSLWKQLKATSWLATVLYIIMVLCGYSRQCGSIKFSYFWQEGGSWTGQPTTLNSLVLAEEYSTNNLEE